MFGFKTGASAKNEKKPAPSGKDEKKPAPSGTANPITDYASGGATRRRMEALDLKDGGMVRGPGTGTSDDVEAVVPEGSYIMPADSTKQIGEQNLAGLGSPVDVNLSNGEYQLPPEQVHAVGVKALDQMKNATHTPADQQGAGFKPELFFADGGGVEDPRRRHYGPRVASYEAGETRVNTPNPALRGSANRPDATPDSPSVWAAGNKIPVGGSALPNSVNRPDTTPDSPSVWATGNKMLYGGLALPFAAAIDAVRSGAASLVDGDPNTLEGGANKYGDAASSTISQGAQDARQIFEGFKAGARDALGVQMAKPQEQAAPTTTPAAPADATPAAPADATPAAPADATPEQDAPTAAAPVVPQAPAQPAAAPAAAPVAAVGGDLPTNAEQRANNITRVGNSFSGTKIGPGATINGRPAYELFQGEQSAQNKVAVDALMARTPVFGAGLGFNPGGRRSTVAHASSQRDHMRERMISAASTPYRGAQNGQLTANQLNTLNSLIQSDDRNATTLATNSENNAVSMADRAMSEQGQNARTQFQEQGQSARAQLQEQGQNARAQLQEQGQNERFAASKALDERRIAGEEEVRGFATRTAQRVERLYEQYEKAKPEDRGAIAQQIRELSGSKEAQNRFTVVPGGQEIDPTTQQLVTRPAMVFNNQTGQFVPQQDGATSQQAPRPGETRGGYRFKGGNPADQNNWEKI